MPIRLPNVHGTPNSRASSATVRDSLQKAVGPDGTLQAAALQGICKAAEQAGPSAMQELKQELSNLLHEAKIGGRNVQLDAGALSLAQSIVQPSGAAPVSKSTPTPIVLHGPELASMSARQRAPARPSAPT